MTRIPELYENPSPLGCLRLARGFFSAEGRLRMQALLLRLRDYVGLFDDPELASFHRDLAKILAESSQGWPHHDYGEGYLYQSFKPLGISGLRATERRVAAMALSERLRGLDVLEVGCNTGFLALSVAPAARKVTGFDINPFAIRIAELARTKLSCGNADFSVSSFEDVRAAGAFDALLSFANHATFDGRTTHTPEEYFRKCRSCLRPGGLLLFESHQPAFENAERLERAVSAMSAFFDVAHREVLAYGTALDTGRTFIAARAR